MKNLFQQTLLTFLVLLCSHQLFAQVDSSLTKGQKDSLGRKQGKWVEFYENGKVQSISYYKDDKIDSTYKTFYITGELEHESYFINGDRNGSSTWYYKDGKIHHLEFYAMAAPIWTSTYDKDGYLVMEEIFRDGKSICVIHYDKGKLVAKGTPKN